MSGFVTAPRLENSMKAASKVPWTGLDVQGWLFMHLGQALPLSDEIHNKQELHLRPNETSAAHLVQSPACSSSVNFPQTTQSLTSSPAPYC